VNRDFFALEKFLHQVRRIFDSMPVAAGPVGSSPAHQLAPAEPADAVDPVELTLYISPTSPPSLKARRNMEKLLQDFRAAEIGFEAGIESTVDWYRDNAWWWEPIRSGEYREYYERQYGTRLGA